MKLSEDDDVHMHTRNEIRQHEVTEQEPRYTDTTCRGTHPTISGGGGVGRSGIDFLVLYIQWQREKVLFWEG